MAKRQIKQTDDNDQHERVLQAQNHQNQTNFDGIIDELSRNYSKACDYFNSENYYDAAKFFAKTVKPLLGNPNKVPNKISLGILKINSSPLNLYEIALDSMYNLALCYKKGELQGKYVDEIKINASWAKAAAIFHYCASFYDKHEEHIKDELHHDYKKIAHEMQFDFLQHKLHLDESKREDVTEKSREYTEKYKKLISGTSDSSDKTQKKSLREKTKDYIEKKTEIKESIKDFYASISVGIKALITEIFQDAQELLGDKPKGMQCEAISFGSLAAGGITPWSDIEFIILINEQEDAEKQEEAKKYGSNLAKLINIMLINIGETYLRTVGVEFLNNFKTGKDEDDWFFDDVTKCGISPDGFIGYACKNPFGRQGHYKKVTENGNVIELPDYELVLTPKELAKFQSIAKVSEAGSWFDTDPHLVQALLITGYICGDLDQENGLHSEYKEEIRKFKAGTSNIMEKGKPVEKNNTKIIEERVKEILEKNLEEAKEFSIKALDSIYLNVKQEYYRKVERVIINFAHYHDIDKCNMWDIIEELQIKIGDESYEYIGNAKMSDFLTTLRKNLNLAVESRLNNYSYNDAQIDNKEIRSMNEQNKKKYINFILDFTKAEKIIRAHMKFGLEYSENSEGVMTVSMHNVTHCFVFENGGAKVVRKQKMNIDDLLYNLCEWFKYNQMNKVQAYLNHYHANDEITFCKMLDTIFGTEEKQKINHFENLTDNFILHYYILNLCTELYYNFIETSPTIAEKMIQYCLKICHEFKFDELINESTNDDNLKIFLADIYSIYGDIYLGYKKDNNPVTIICHIKCASLLEAIDINASYKIATKGMGATLEKNYMLSRYESMHHNFINFFTPKSISSFTNDVHNKLTIDLIKYIISEFKKYEEEYSKLKITLTDIKILAFIEKITFNNTVDNVTDLVSIVNIEENLNEEEKESEITGDTQSNN